MSFTEIFRVIGDIKAQLKGVPHFRWGIVTATDPLTVRLDADDDPLDGVPSTLVAGLMVGDRVHVMVQNRRAVVIGRAKGTDQYRPGDEYRFNIGSDQLPLTGMATSSATWGLVQLPIPKTIAQGTTPVLRELWANGRTGTGGYWNLAGYQVGGHDLVRMPGITTSIRNWDVNLILLSIEAGSALLSTNNQVFSLDVNRIDIDFI